MTKRWPKHRRIEGLFVPRPRAMLESPPYRVLSGTGHRILARVEIEHLSHGGRENGRLPVTFQNFVEFGIDRHSIAPGIRECVALRFLEVTREGKGGNAEFRRPNMFRLTYVHTDQPPAEATNEWKLIGSVEEAKEKVKKARVPIRRARLHKLRVVR